MWTIDALVFGSLATLVAGLTLLMVAGRGRLDPAALRDPHTWAYGLIDALAVTLTVGASRFAGSETGLLAAILCVVGGSTIMLLARYARRPAVVPDSLTAD